LATEYSVVQKRGREISVKDRESCVAVIRDGCAVNPTSAAKELPKAVSVAILYADGKIVGVGTIKRPRCQYAKSIADSEHSGFAFDPKMNELGYVAVLPDHRGGHSCMIMNSLLEDFDGPLWATTSAEPMKHSLCKRGFRNEGKEWLNPKGKSLSLWIRNARDTRVP
jgi:hypothetical protein